MRTEDEAWDEVYDHLRNAYSMAWDGCHKIYINMDQEQHEKMVSYGYGEDGSQLRLTNEIAEDAELIERCWAESCGLRFINAVSTNNLGDMVFTGLIEQFEFDEDEEEGNED